MLQWKKNQSMLWIFYCCHILYRSSYFPFIFKNNFYYFGTSIRDIVLHLTFSAIDHDIRDAKHISSCTTIISKIDLFLVLTSLQMLQLHQLHILFINRISIKEMYIEEKSIKSSWSVFGVFHSIWQLLW